MNIIILSTAAVQLINLYLWILTEYFLQWCFTVPQLAEETTSPDGVTSGVDTALEGVEGEIVPFCLEMRSRRGATLEHRQQKKQNAFEMEYGPCKHQCGTALSSGGSPLGLSKQTAEAALLVMSWKLSWGNTCSDPWLNSWNLAQAHILCHVFFFNCFGMKAHIS